MASETDPKDTTTETDDTTDTGSDTTAEGGGGKTGDVVIMRTGN